MVPFILSFLHQWRGFEQKVVDCRSVELCSNTLRLCPLTSFNNYLPDLIISKIYNSFVKYTRSTQLKLIRICLFYLGLMREVGCCKKKYKLSLKYVSLLHFECFHGNIGIATSEQPEVLSPSCPSSKTDRCFRRRCGK